MKKIIYCLGFSLFVISSTAVAQNSVKSVKVQALPDSAKIAAAAPKTPFDGIVKFKKETMDFGTTKLNSPATVEFSYTNIGKEPLIIQSAQPSCGCTTPNWTKEPVLPGKGGKITATYNASALGQVNKTVFVNFKGISQSLELHLTGKVIK